MPLTFSQSAIVVAVVAVLTFLTRLLPFAVFGGKREAPKIIQYLGKVLPLAIMATLVIYCVKSVEVTTFPYGLPELISIALVTGLHLWRKNVLLSIGAGTVCYMVLVQVVFA